MTTIRIESDSEEDRGKKFAGQEIKIVPKVKRRSSGGGGSSGSSSKKTVVYIVSDASEDQGRTFGGQKILSPQEYEQIRKSSSSSVNVQSRQTTAQEKAAIAEQLRKEAEEREKARQEQRQQKIEKIQSSNVKDELSKRVQQNISSEIRERQANASIQQTSSGPLKVNNPNKKIDNWFVRAGKGVLSLPGAIASGAKKKFYDKPKEINKEFVDTGFASQYSNYQQVVFGEQTPSTEVLQVKQNFDTKKAQIETKYKEDSDVKTFDKTALAASVLVGGEVLAGVKGAGAIASVARGTGQTIKTAADVAGVGFGVKSVYDAAKDPTPENIGQALFAGGVGVVSGVSLVNKVKGASTTVTPIKSSSETVSIATKEGTLGVESVNLRGTYEVKSGLIKKKTQTVEVEGQGMINKEVRALGEKPPQVQRPVENPLSTEFSETTIGQGQINVNVKGFGEKNVNVDFLQQGNKQITTVDKTTSISKTENVGKLNNENIFKTTSRDLKTGDLEVTLSKEVQQVQHLKSGKTVADDIFSSASRSETDIFIKNKDLKTTPEKVIDVKTTSSANPEKLQLSGKTDEIQIFKPNKPKSSNNSRSSSSSSSSSSRGGQEQIFEMKSQSQNTQIVPKQRTNLSSEMRQRAENIIRERKTSNVSIPSQVVRDIVVKGSSKGSSLFPGIASVTGFVSGSSQGQSPSQSQSPFKVQDQIPAKDQPQDKLPGRGQEKTPAKDQPQDQTPSFDNPMPNKSKSTNDNIFKTPTPPTGPPKIKIGPPPTTPKLAMFPSFGGFQPKSQAGYDVFIRENGKRIKANKQPIPYNMALKQGKNVVDNTVAASFELMKRGTTNIPDIPSQVIGDKFRARRTKNALKVVEKSKNRIDTTGEKQGLTVAKFLKGGFKL